MYRGHLEDPKLDLVLNPMAQASLQSQAQQAPWHRDSLQLGISVGVQVQVQVQVQDLRTQAPAPVPLPSPLGGWGKGITRPGGGP